MVVWRKTLNDMMNSLLMMIILNLGTNLVNICQIIIPSSYANRIAELQ